MRRTGATLVLVHSAWHDSRCWDAVGFHLDGRRRAWRSVTLPSTEHATAPVHPLSARPGFGADVEAVGRVLGTIGTDVVLCGHGYGGMVISEAGNHPAVTGLVYIGAWAPWPGESLAHLASGLSGSPAFRWPVLRVRQGWTEMSPRWAGRFLYPDLTWRWAARMAVELRPSSSAIFRARASSPAWMRKPAVYAVCARDRMVGARRARAMARRVVRSQLAIGCSRTCVVTLDTDHSPFYSAPGLVADLLTGRY